MLKKQYKRPQELTMETDSKEKLKKSGRSKKEEGMGIRSKVFTNHTKKYKNKQNTGDEIKRNRGKTSSKERGKSLISSANDCNKFENSNDFKFKDTQNDKINKLPSEKTPMVNKMTQTDSSICTQLEVLFNTPDKLMTTKEEKPKNITRGEIWLNAAFYDSTNHKFDKATLIGRNRRFSDESEFSDTLVSPFNSPRTSFSSSTTTKLFDNTTKVSEISFITEDKYEKFTGYKTNSHLLSPTEMEREQEILSMVQELDLLCSSKIEDKITLNESYNNSKCLGVPTCCINAMLMPK